MPPRATPSRAPQKSLGAKLHVCSDSERTSLNIGLRVVSHESGLKLECGHRPLILLGRVGVPHDPPNTRPHREGCDSGTGFVQDLQRLQSGHSGKVHWRPMRLDTRLRSARARGPLTSGGQAEKRQCFSRQSPARETKGNASDGAKRQRGHGHFKQTTTPTGTETRRQGVTDKVWKGRGWRREGVERGGRSREGGGGGREVEKRTVVEGGAQAQLFSLGKRAVKRTRRPQSNGSRTRRLKSAASASHAPLRQNLQLPLHAAAAG